MYINEEQEEEEEVKIRKELDFMYFHHPQKNTNFRYIKLFCILFHSHFQQNETFANRSFHVEKYEKIPAA